MAAPEHDDAARQQALDEADRALAEAQNMIDRARSQYAASAQSEMLASLATSVAALGRLVVFALREDEP